jgi:small conductance mechanosensitive channel
LSFSTKIRRKVKIRKVKMSFETIMKQVIPYTEITVSRLIFAIIVLVMGFVLSKYIIHVFRRGLQKTNMIFFE